MVNQFSRTQLLLSAERMERLYAARVAVFGVGGVGGHVAEALARSGVGALDLIDNDQVCLSNLNRQIIATRATIGQYKVDAARDRIADINPDALVICHGGPISEPKDAAYVIEHVPGIDGFFGATSIERLASERGIKAQTEAFKAIKK